MNRYGLTFGAGVTLGVFFEESRLLTYRRPLLLPAPRSNSLSA
jgi:hypothetical protein